MFGKDRQTARERSTTSHPLGLAEGTNGSRLFGFACGRDDGLRKWRDLASPRPSPRTSNARSGAYWLPERQRGRQNLSLHHPARSSAKMRDRRAESLAAALTQKRQPPCLPGPGSSAFGLVREDAKERVERQTNRQKHKWRPNQSVRRHRQAATVRPCLNPTRPPSRCQGFFSYEQLPVEIPEPPQACQPPCIRRRPSFRPLSRAQTGRASIDTPAKARAEPGTAPLRKDAPQETRGPGRTR